MTRRPRDFTQHLRAFWARRFPERASHERKEFNDELLVAVDMLMYQYDPTGTKPILHPPGYADGYDPQPSVRPTGVHMDAE